MAISRVGVVALLAVSIGCVSPVGTPGRPSQEAEYLIAPPDVLAISVRPEPEITRIVTVRPDGRISFDLIGDVLVAGRTVTEVRAEIAAKAREFIVRPDVTVTLKASNSRRYFVFGEVLRPGAYPLVGEVTAVQALAAAAGPTRFALMGDARLVRPTAEADLTYAVDFSAIIKRGRGDTNYTLQPGDVIYVPPNFSARLGYAVQVVLFPLQQIIGLGGSAVARAATF